MKEGEKVALDIAKKVRTLLEEFSDVMHNYLADGLPPLRGIEHHIDLVSGSSLPNLSHYYKIPKEHKELQRQVNE